MSGSRRRESNLRKAKRNRRFIGVVVAVGALTLAGTAYTNANTFADPARAGAGSQAISGYQVSEVHYDLNATDPQNIDSIDFTLDNVPGPNATIKYRLANAAAWSGDCANVGAVVSDCAAPVGSTVAGTTNLTVVVAD